MVRIIFISVSAVLLVACLPGVGPAFTQSGYDRPGGDYSSASVPNGDPAVCAARCERDNRCRAWSFSYPPESGGTAQCWLKKDVVPAVEASCCVSGVRGAGVIEPHGTIEYSIDRTGGDYRSFETKPDPKGKACADACQGENKCRAWTYRRPGYSVTVAHCYLKDAIKPPRRRPCCISGVVR